MAEKKGIFQNLIEGIGRVVGGPAGEAGFKFGRETVIPKVQEGISKLESAAASGIAFVSPAKARILGTPVRGPEIFDIEQQKPVRRIVTTAGVPATLGESIRRGFKAPKEKRLTIGKLVKQEAPTFGIPGKGKPTEVARKVAGAGFELVGPEDILIPAGGTILKATKQIPTREISKLPSDALAKLVTEKGPEALKIAEEAIKSEKGQAEFRSASDLLQQSKILQKVDIPKSPTITRKVDKPSQLGLFEDATEIVQDTIPGIELRAQQKYAENLNLERVNVPQKVKEDLVRAVDEVKPDLDRLRGKTLSNKEAVEASQDLTKQFDVLTEEVGRESTKNWIAAQTRLRESYTNAIKEGKVTPDLLESLRIDLSNTTDIARKLQSRSIKVSGEKGAFVEKVLREFVKHGKTNEEILKVMEGVDVNNVQEVTKVYRDLVKPSLTEIFDEFRYGNMLSSPKTHAVNFTSNAIQSAILEPTLKFIDGTQDIFASLLKGGKRERYISEIPVYYRGLLNAIPEASRAAMDVIRGKESLRKPDIDTIPTLSKLTAPQQFVLKVLESGDALWTTLVKEGEAKALMHRLSKQGIDPNTVDINKLATDKAAELLFRKALDPSNKEGQGKLLAAIDQATDALFSARGKFKPLEWSVPFIQTPMNMLKQYVEVSPLGLATLPGNTDKTRQLSKSILGSTIFAASMAFLQDNDATWAAPISKKEREEFFNTGRKPFSVKIGDNWVSYDKLGPIAFPLAMAAAVKYNTEQSPSSLTDSNAEKLTAVLGSLMEFFADQSYLEGVNNLLKTVQDPEQYLPKLISDNLRQSIPLTALQGWVARTIDPIYRDPGSTVERILTGIPILSTTVAPHTNQFGEPSVRKNAIFNSLSPVHVNPQETNAVFENIWQKRQADKKYNSIVKKVKDGKISQAEAIKALEKLKQIRERFIPQGEEPLTDAESEALDVGKVVPTTRRKGKKVRVTKKKTPVIKIARTTARPRRGARRVVVQAPKFEELLPEQQRRINLRLT